MSDADITPFISSAVPLIRSAKYLTAFTGAGISVESGIPPFRGPGGLWGKYDPDTLQIDYFLRDPARAWPTIKEIFYDNFGKAQPNTAHRVLARLEVEGWPRSESEPGAGSAKQHAAGARGHLQMLITRTSILCNGTDGDRSLIPYRAGLRFPVAQNRERKTQVPKMFCAMDS